MSRLNVWAGAGRRSVDPFNAWDQACGGTVQAAVHMAAVSGHLASVVGETSMVLPVSAVAPCCAALCRESNHVKMHGVVCILLGRWECVNHST